VAGGLETYLQQLAPELRRRGCEIAILSETNSSDARPEIIATDGVPLWFIAELGV